MWKVCTLPLLSLHHHHHQTWKNDREHITKQIRRIQLSKEVGQTSLSPEKEKKHNGEIEADLYQLFSGSGGRWRYLGGWVQYVVGDQSPAPSLNWLGSGFLIQAQNCARADVSCLSRQTRSSWPSLSSRTWVLAPQGCSWLLHKYPKQQDNTWFCTETFREVEATTKWQPG